MYSRSLLTLVLFSVLFATVPCGTTPARAQEGEGAEQQPAADTEKQAKSSDKLFPDPALEAAVRKEVFAKRYNDEPLTKEDVKDVSQVVAIGKGIENLEGLQHLVSLRLIRLTDNKVKDLAPLAELKLLQSIDLAKNQISDIAPLADLTRVQLLELSGNQIERIDAIKNMDNMRTLWLADNQIESLEPIAGLGKIGSLDLAGNGLKDDDLAPLGKLSWLTHLQLSRNQVSSLEPLRPLRQLSMLLLEENQLEQLDALVEMCRRDVEGEKRFAPYLRLYLRGNPLTEATLQKQVPTLREFGVEVVLE